MNKPSLGAEVKLRALGTRIIARRITDSRDDKDGFRKSNLIYTPKPEREESSQCEVVAIGPKVEDLKVGEVVIIGKYVDLELKEENLVVFQEADIRAVVIPDA